MTLSCIAAFAPLVGAILAGFLGWKLGRVFSHSVTILSVAISFAASAVAFWQVLTFALNAILFHLAATANVAPYLVARVLVQSLVYFGFSLPLWSRIFSERSAS